MGINISFELSDQDLEHFKVMASQAQAGLESGADEATILTGCRELLETVASQAELPQFVSERLSSLEGLVDMLEDQEWQLSQEDRERVLSAVAYFANPEDLIPDRVPGLGFLDDAIMIKLVEDNLTDEIASYRDFCKFRTSEEQRRANQGLPTDVSREDWLADQRAVLHSRMRERRAQRLSSGGWRSVW